VLLEVGGVHGIPQANLAIPVGYSLSLALCLAYNINKWLIRFYNIVGCAMTK
jgi:hypothetical protein